MRMEVIKNLKQNQSVKTLDISEEDDQSIRMKDNNKRICLRKQRLLNTRSDKSINLI
jgi:hypothetical protein